MSIATKLAKLKTIKQDIKSALEEKGQTPSNVFSTYANNIRAIETGGITPSGELAITENGTYDVTNYSSANVNVASSSGSDLDSFIDGSITELTSNATSIYTYCFYNNRFITKYNFPNATSIGEHAFADSIIVSINAPNIGSIQKEVFSYCYDLNEINFNSVTFINANAFSNCKKLIDIEFNNLKTLYANAFYECNYLNSIKMPLIRTIYNSFDRCYSLKEILIEQTNKVCTLSSSSCFNSCYHILGTTNSTYNPNGLKDGYIYVPASLLSQYKVATNWTIHASQIVGHQDYVVGDELVNYSNETYTNCTWYSDKEMTIEVASVESNGRYYCKLEA